MSSQCYAPRGLGNILEKPQPECGKILWDFNYSEAKAMQETQIGYKQKHWHFDPTTERKAASSESDGKPYKILNATEKDFQQVVGFYQNHPVEGFDIGKVEVIYNPVFNKKFQCEMESLQHRDKSPNFAPKWNVENNAQWRAEINKKFEELAKPYTDNDFPAVKILPLWHGTKRGILDSIFKTGYANLATTDSGYFGKGLYGAYEAEYSYRVYGPGTNGSEGVLILNWVASFSAYPVIDGDMDKLRGGNNYKNYDSHFVPVISLNPNDKNGAAYYPCKPNQKNVYTEMVVFQSAACLPRYLVTLQSNKPQPSISKLTSPTLQNQQSTKKTSILDSKSDKTEKSWQEIENISKSKNNTPVPFPASTTTNFPKVPETSDYTCENTFKGHSKIINCIAIISNKKAISGSSDKTLRVWDLVTDECERTLEGHRDIVCCVVVHNGNAVSGSKDKTLKVWNIATGKCEHTLEGHSDTVTCVAVLPNGEIISGSNDKTLRVWNLDTGKCENILRGHNGVIKSIAALGDDKIISGSEDDTLKVWDLVKGSCVKTLQGHTNSILCVVALSKKIAMSASYDKTLKIWDITTGNCEITLSEHNSPFFSLAVFADGKKAISGSSDKTLKVWDTATGKIECTLNETSPVYCVSVLPNGKIISGAGNNLKVWRDIEKQNQLTKALLRGNFELVKTLENQGASYISR